MVKKNLENIKSAKTLIVLGSGGHTTEMIEIVKNLDFEKYKPRYYILADTDKTSEQKISEIEHGDTKDYTFTYICRSRHVMQNYFSSMFTTLLSILNCFTILRRIQPDLILCNGPGTCVPVCLVAYLYKSIGLIPKNTKIVFVESFCRVKTVSLSGKILQYISDLFVVQWPDLKQLNKNYKYYGKLM